MRKITVLALAFAASLSMTPSASAQEKPVGAGEAAKHTMFAPSDLPWGDAPPGVPAGAKMAVLYGDPSKAAPFAIRVKGADGYTLPPHWHPTDEQVTVISGAFYMGTGDKFEKPKAKAMTAGAFGSMPAKMHHFGWFKGYTEIEIHSMGPFEITYVNPADDPRNAKK